MSKTYIQTFTGNAFWPLDPDPKEVRIKDIAHSLSMQCRFNGATSEFYSVAQHCVIVSNLVPDEFALEGLLHDASEAYLCDLPKPIKEAEELWRYRAAESYLQETIFRVFRVKTMFSSEVHAADMQLLATEARDFMKEHGTDWGFDAEPLPGKIAPVGPVEAKRMFLKRFSQLIKMESVEGAE